MLRVSFLLRRRGSPDSHYRRIAAMPADPILHALIEAVSADYEVFGELGRREDRSIAFLARTWSTRALMVLVLSPGGEGADEEYSLEVFEKLDARVPEPPHQCSQCHTALRPWARFCSRCGHDASGLAASGALGPEELRKLAEGAEGGKYELIGEMPRAGGGGAVYFGRNRQSGKVAILRLELNTDARVAVSATQTLKTLEAPAQARPGSDRDSRKKAGRVSVIINPGNLETVTESHPPSATPKPQRHSLTGNEPSSALTKTEALAVLGLDATATEGEIRRRYQDLYSEYRVRETNAPTSALRLKYRSSVASIEAAGSVLLST